MDHSGGIKAEFTIGPTSAPILYSPPSLLVYYIFFQNLSSYCVWNTNDVTSNVTSNITSSWRHLVAVTLKVYTKQFIVRLF